MNTSAAVFGTACLVACAYAYGRRGNSSPDGSAAPIGVGAQGSIFAISDKNGYLPKPGHVLETLPARFTALDKLMDKLPNLLADPNPNALKTEVQRLPQYAIKSDGPLSPEVLQALMRDYSILVSAFLLEGKTKTGAPRTRVPRNIAVPFSEVAAMLQEETIMSYDSYCLANCRHVDGKPYAEWEWEHLRLIRAFDGGPEEATFVLVHSEIEAKTPDLVRAFDTLMAAAPPSLLDGSIDMTAGRPAQVRQGLEAVREVMSRVLVSQLKMFNASNPRNYEVYVRPWIFGWKGNADFPNGVVFEGVNDDKPTALRGETGAQSTIIPSMDAVFGITHRGDKLQDMLRELEAYRPKPHRDYLSMLRQRFWGADQGAGGAVTEHRHRTHALRDYVRRLGDRSMARLFNECVALVWCFRDVHVTFADAYISRFTAKETATGGTPFKAYLRKHRDESIAHQITDWEDAVVRFTAPSAHEQDAEVDFILDERTVNGIPPHLLARHRDIIQRYGHGSLSLSSKQFPSRAQISKW